jgi:hypothetical protein
MSERISIGAGADYSRPVLWAVPHILKRNGWENLVGAQSESFSLEKVFPKFVLYDEDNVNSASSSLFVSNFSALSQVDNSPHFGNAQNAFKTDLERFKQAFLQKEVEKELFALFESEQIEDGYSHPAEKFIESVCRKYRAVAGTLFQGIYLKNIKRAAFIACLLRSVGRLKNELVAPWGMVLAISGLSHYSVEVRDAAVRVLEMWGGNESLSVLKIYADIETVAWLKAYIEQVIRDLSE